jgi:hypothetical protein
MTVGNCLTTVLVLLALAVPVTEACGQAKYEPYAFTNFAGMPGGAGNVDDIGSAARFQFFLLGAPFGSLT